MTNFIYEREDYVERLKETVRKHEACNYDDYITLNELLDHIEAQGKQLRELNAAITKKNAIIEKYEREKDVLQKNNSCLIKKVDELNEGIRDPEDLTWKQKYDALLHGSEQAIAALQKKCQEYNHSEDDTTISAIETLSETNKKLEESNKRLKNRRGELMRRCDELYMANEEFNEKYEDLEKNRDELLAERDALRNENNALKEEVNLYVGLCNTKHEEVEALAKAVRCPWGNNAEIISVKTARIKELEEKNKKLEERRDGLKKMCEDIMVEKNAIIKELEEKNETLKTEIASKEQIISTFDANCNHMSKKVVELRKELDFWKASDALNTELYLTKCCNKAEEKNKKLERANLDPGDTIGWYVEEFKKLKEDFEKEKQVSKDLNVIINSKNKLLDEYMTKCNNLEHNYKEEVRMKEQFKSTCFKHEETIKKLKRDNVILRRNVDEISDLAESIVMLCDDEE